ncbi:MAG: response regulator [SAR324 cluster bacterium]|nr:response regulator [SAR324 cluster bacterium]
MFFHSLRFSIPSFLFVFILILGLWNYSTDKVHLVSQAEKDALENLTFFANSQHQVISTAINREELDFVQRQVAVIAGNPNFQTVLLTDENLKIISSSQIDLITHSITSQNLMLSSYQWQQLQKAWEQIKVDEKPQVFLATEGSLAFALLPIQSPRKQGEFRSLKVGLFLIVEDLSSQKEQALAYALEEILHFSWILILLTLVLGIIFDRFVTRRLKIVIHYLGEVSKGNFDIKTTITGKDEVAALARSLEDMAKKIDDATAEINAFNQQLESKVVERTSALGDTLIELEDAKLAAEAADKAKSQFLANMSHEIRTPMNGILGLARICLRTELTTQQQDYLKKIDLSGNNLLKIINEILDFSKLESHSIEIEEIDFSTEVLFDNISSIFYQETTEKGLELLFDCSSNMPKFLKGDPYRIGQVLTNLVGNAVKFTKKGQVLIAAKVLETRGQVITLELSVQDSGLGMTPKEMEKLFTPFSQADASTTRQFGGTGLGLTISKRLAELMGGQITVTSELGKGSAFTFRVQTKMSDEIDRKLTFPQSWKEMQVLVVDDNVPSAMLLEKILMQFGFSVQTVHSGAEALELMKAENFDLALVDWQMPTMNGLELGQKILMQIETDRRPKLIMVTAFGKLAVKKDAFAGGFSGFINKPLQASELFDCVVSVLHKDSLNQLIHKPEANQLGEFEFEGLHHVAKLKGAKILVAEDNKINQQIIKEILETAAFQVDIAENGFEALEALAQEKYHGILMDVQMPKMDGLEATKQIRKMERFKDLPIIALTANAMAKDREECLSAGMDGHVPKPIDSNFLFLTLKQWISPPREELHQILPEKISPGKSENNGNPLNIEALKNSNIIDVRAGLTRVNGNQSLFKKLLCNFAEDTKNVSFEAKELIEQKNWNELRTKLHNIKGISGNLGMDLLFENSWELEKMILESRFADLHQNLEPFFSSLQRVQVLIKKVCIDETEKDLPPLGTKIIVTNAELLTKLVHLEDQLQLQIPKLCKAALAEIKELYWPTELQAMLGQLTSFIDKYLFKDAILLVKHLSEQVSGEKDA